MAPVLSRRRRLRSDEPTKQIKNDELRRSVGTWSRRRTLLRKRPVEDHGPNRTIRRLAEHSQVAIERAALGKSDCRIWGPGVLEGQLNRLVAGDPNARARPMVA